MLMGVVGWIVLGFIGGNVSSLLVNRDGEGLAGDILLGIVGAVIGGWIFSAAGAGVVRDFNAWSLLIAAEGAMVVLVLWHAIRRSVSYASAS